VTDQLALFDLDADGLPLEEAVALAADLLEHYSSAQPTRGSVRARSCRCLRPGVAYWEDGVAICFACGHERGGEAP
jgi:hypothetical protein